MRVQLPWTNSTWRPIPTGLGICALALAAGTIGSLNRVWAQSFRSPAGILVAQAVPLKAPDPALAPPADNRPTEADQRNLRKELEALLRQREKLDDRIADLRGKMRTDPETRGDASSLRARIREEIRRATEGIRRSPDTPRGRERDNTLGPQEERRIAEESRRIAEEAMQQAREAMRQAERALQESRRALPRRDGAFVPTIPAIPPLPRLPRFEGSPDAANPNAADRAMRDEWEKRRPEFEREMREFQTRMQQWQQEFRARMREQFRKQDQPDRNPEQKPEQKAAPPKPVLKQNTQPEEKDEDHLTT